MKPKLVTRPDRVDGAESNGWITRSRASWSATPGCSPRRPTTKRGDATERADRYADDFAVSTSASISRSLANLSSSTPAAAARSRSAPSIATTSE